MLIVVKIIWALSVLGVVLEFVYDKRGSGPSLAIALFMLLLSSVAIFFMTKYE